MSLNSVGPMSEDVPLQQIPPPESLPEYDAMYGQVNATEPPAAAHNIEAPVEVPEEDPEDGPGCFGFVMIGFSYLLTLLFFPLSLCSVLKIVNEYERAVNFRLGRIEKQVKGPGLFFILPCVDDLKYFDMRTLSSTVPQQQILTDDGIQVAVDAVIYTKILDPLKAVTAVEDLESSITLISQTSLRSILGIRTLSQILSDRAGISDELEVDLAKTARNWGIKVERVEVKDVRIPYDMQRAMATEAEASREAKAKVIAAEGEKLASQAIAEAAAVMATTKSAVQLRYLQTLTSVSANKNHTIVMPMPIDMMMMSLQGKI